MRTNRSESRRAGGFTLAPCTETDTRRPVPELPDLRPPSAIDFCVRSGMEVRHPAAEIRRKMRHPHDRLRFINSRRWHG